MVYRRRLIAVATAMSTSAFQHLSQEFANLQQEEDKERTGMLKNHKTHELVKLAKACGLNLSRQEAQFLKCLEVLVQLGRYPTPFQAVEVNIEAHLDNGEAKSSLNKKIFDKHIELIDL